jgi:flagellin
MHAVSTAISASKPFGYLNISAYDPPDSRPKAAPMPRIAKSSGDISGATPSTATAADVHVAGTAAIKAAPAIAILKTAEAAAANVADMLARMRALAVQAAAARTTTAERGELTVAFASLAAAITAVVLGARVRKPSQPADADTLGKAEAGADTGDILTLDPFSPDLTAAGLGVDRAAVDTQGNAVQAVATLDDAMDQVLVARALLGAQQAQLEFQAATMAGTEGVPALDGTIEDVEAAAENARLLSAQMKAHAAAAATASANQIPPSLLQLIQ